MNEAERRALAALKFDLAPTPDDVWRPSPYHVAELHRDVVENIFEGVALAKSGDRANPLGVVIKGQSGSGKTHMLGMVRTRTQSDGGYFFLVSLLSGRTFWESTALCIVEGLLRESVGWPTQLKAFLRRLTPMLGLTPGIRDAIAGDAPLRPEHAKAFVAGLRQFDRAVGQETQDTALALVLHGADDLAAQDLGYAFLNSLDLADFPDRARWGLGSGTRPPQLIVRDISRLLALTGSPTVFAIDQVDTLFAQSTRSMVRDGGGIDQNAAITLGQVADGLLTLREVTRRALVVVACLPDTWKLIRDSAATPVPDRFRETSTLDTIPTPKIGLAIVRKRLDARYSQLRFTPPYPTWPVKELAFADVGPFTPRALLKRVERHAAECLGNGKVTELERLEDPVGALATPPRRAVDSSALATLDARFANLILQADVNDALEHTTEDRRMPVLLAAGLRALIEELGGKEYRQDPLPSGRAPLHARLRQILDEGLEDERHWGMRAIASGNANAVITRVRAACTIAGLDASVPNRRLFLLRNHAWPTGPKTTATVKEFHDAGGRTVPITVDDLLTFEALRVLQAEPDEHLADWLRARTPASGTALVQAIFGDLESSPRAQVPALAPDGAASPQPRDLPATPPPGPVVRLGVDDSGRPLELGLEALRRHAVVFAGSGSGKTVLIRRLVEECALKGVSAIVLDPNNDLARLGDEWPQSPRQWGPGDADRAREYRDRVDVSVWTPMVDSGRSLTFQPLPNLEAVRDDPDEFRAAVDVAVSALAPRAKMDGETAKAQQGQAVLRDALRHYAHRGGNEGMRAFVGMLAALPDGVTQLAKGERLAAEMADTLTAAMVNDPLFGGEGTPVDPGVLLTPPEGKRARISVISFVGLHSEGQRQGFVNQLQMALFGWIRRHPAGDRPLRGLLVMDEAQTLAPSNKTTACTASTLALVSQARKYGLGLVFATQAPRGLHNQIPGNAATQFFGLLNSPIQIAAAKEMAQAKGGSVADIGLLAAGQFYATSEGMPFRKVRTPLCLSYHANAALTPEEVIDRARRR